MFVWKLLSLTCLIIVGQAKQFSPRRPAMAKDTSHHRDRVMTLRGGGDLADIVSKTYLMVSAAQGVACASAPEVTMQQFGRGEPSTNEDMITFQFGNIGRDVISQVVLLTCLTHGQGLGTSMGAAILVWIPFFTGNVLRQTLTKKFGAPDDLKFRIGWVFNVVMAHLLFNHSDPVLITKILCIFWLVTDALPGIISPKTAMSQYKFAESITSDKTVQTVLRTHFFGLAAFLAPALYLAFNPDFSLLKLQAMSALIWAASTFTGLVIAKDYNATNSHYFWLLFHLGTAAYLYSAA